MKGVGRIPGRDIDEDDDPEEPLLRRDGPGTPAGPWRREPLCGGERAAGSCVYVQPSQPGEPVPRDPGSIPTPRAICGGFPSELAVKVLGMARAQPGDF